MKTYTLIAFLMLNVAAFAQSNYFETVELSGTLSQPVMTARPPMPTTGLVTNITIITEIKQAKDGRVLYRSTVNK